jgi:hypothetical protein
VLLSKNKTLDAQKLLKDSEKAFPLLQRSEKMRMLQSFILLNNKGSFADIQALIPGDSLNNLFLLAEYARRIQNPALIYTQLLALPTLQPNLF